jgi:hypothetical protein
MWARVKDNNIVEYYNNKKSIVLNNVRYSSQIFTIWTDEERVDLGIYSVEKPDFPDMKFHKTSEITYTFNAEQKKVIGTHTVSDRELEDKNAVDKDGNTILDNHNNPEVNLGLKSTEVNTVKLEAANLIKPYAWLIQRKVTADKDIPADVLTYIANVRTKCGEICTALTNASNMTEFKQVFESKKRNDFPDDYDIKDYKR